MPLTHEQRARENIDAQLTASGWVVLSRDEVSLQAGRGAGRVGVPRLVREGRQEALGIPYLGGEPQAAAVDGAARRRGPQRGAGEGNGLQVDSAD